MQRGWGAQNRIFGGRGGLVCLPVGMYAGKVSVAQWLELGAHNA